MTTGEGQPRRIQLSRRKGWRMPENTVSVARPGRYGNQYIVGVNGTVAECVAWHRADLEDAIYGSPGLHRALILAHLAGLRGRNVACWCGLDAPCHGDTLLDLANSPARSLPQTDGRGER